MKKKTTGFVESSSYFYICLTTLKVRKATAEQLYTTFLTYDEVLPDQHNDDIMEILTEVSW